MLNADTTITAAQDADPAIGLRSIAVLRRLTDHLETRQVASARRAGWTWQQIGDALGVSRQAVHKKHAAADRHGSRRTRRSSKDV